MKLKTDEGTKEHTEINEEEKGRKGKGRKMKKGDEAGNRKGKR